MTSKSTYYGLTLYDDYDDEDKVFFTFRVDLAGTQTGLETGSNMNIIDEVLHLQQNQLDTLTSGQNMKILNATYSGTGSIYNINATDIISGYVNNIFIVLRITDENNRANPKIVLTNVYPGDTAKNLVRINTEGNAVNLIANEIVQNGLYLFKYDSPLDKWVYVGTSVTDETIAISDVTINDVSTSKHGFAPKAVAASSGNLNVYGIANGETAITNKALFNTTAPNGISTTGSSGSSTVAARYDHVHAGLDTNTSLGTSDTVAPTQNAVKVYVDGIVDAANALVYKGVIGCSGNPNYPAASAGYMYIVSVAGKIGGASGINVEVGDMLICNTDATPSGDQATVGSKWNIIQKNIDGAVTGPASSTNNAIAIFNGTDGKVIKDGVAPGTSRNVLVSNGTSWTSDTIFQTYPVVLPSDLGTPSVGSSSYPSRQDHVHLMPTLDGLSSPTDITTLNATTSAHGLAPKAVAPATANELKVLSVLNGGTSYTNNDIFGNTLPSALGSASYGTGVEASRVNHVHAMPTASDVGAIASTITTTKGDLIVRGASANTRLAVGATNGHILTINNSATNGIEWAAPSGVTDGDKGDITVSSSGATWTIDNSVVTYAKIQNVTTDRLLGRSTAGSGVVEEITPSTGLSLSGGNLSATLTTSSTDTFTNKRITQRVTSPAFSATPSINTDNYDAVELLALTGAITSMTTNLTGSPTNFQKLTIRFKDDGTARAITWGASFASRGATLPTTTVAGKYLTVGFIYNSNTTAVWDCVAVAQEA